MGKNYISLNDYAKHCSITIEEARSKLDSPKYESYIIRNDKGILVSFDIFNLKDEEVPLPDTKDRAEQEIEVPLQETIDGAEQEEEVPLVETDEERQEVPLHFEKEIETLRQEVQELKEVIAEKDKQIADYTLKFAELAQQAQIIAGQAQVLHLTDKTESQDDSGNRPIEEVAPARINTFEGSMKKQSFWNRLLRRR